MNGRTSENKLQNVPGLILSGLSFLFLGIFALSPETFSDLCREGQRVESFSAIFLFLASGFAVRSALIFYGAKDRRWFGMSICAFLYLIIGLEEISWGQHIFHFDTPEIALGNDQKEFNFHNFATTFFESGYYLGAWVLTVFFSAVSGLKSQTPAGIPWFRWPRVGGAAFTAGVLASSYSDRISKQVPSQICYQTILWVLYAVTAWILIRCLLTAMRERKSRFYFGCLFAHHLTAQALLWFRASSLIRPWDATEYREFFIAVSLFAYAAEIRGQAEIKRKSS